MCTNHLLWSQIDAELLGDVQPVPFVIHHDDFSCHGLLGAISHLLAAFAVESPLQGQRVLGFDLCLVGIAVGNPLSIHLHLCTRDVEDDTLVVALAERDGGVALGRSGEFCRHEIFQEESSWIDEMKGLCLSV